MMRAITVLSLGMLLLLATATATEASIHMQCEGTAPSARHSSLQVFFMSEDNADARSEFALGGCDIFGSFAGADIWRIASDSNPSIFACDLLNITGIAGQSDPPAAVIWSLLAICVTGVKCRTPRRVLGGESQDAVSRNVVSRCAVKRGGQRKSGTARAPWPEHVRAAILQVIARDSVR